MVKTVQFFLSNSNIQTLKIQKKNQKFEKKSKGYVFLFFSSFFPNFIAHFFTRFLFFDDWILWRETKND